MTKWDRVFRIAVVLLLSANLAVSSVICARLANVTPAVSSGESSSAEEKVGDYAEPIAPESPAATDAWYDRTMPGYTKLRIMWRLSVWEHTAPTGIL